MALIAAEGNDTLAEVAPILVAVQAALGLGSFGLGSRGRRRRFLAMVSGVLLLVVGLIGLASIGLGFVMAAAFCFYEVKRTGRRMATDNR
ncbi:hypothetical protein BH23ACT12_BH23ACT12_21200 [soil metagenome]